MIKGITQLGNKTPLPECPEDAVLETFTNPYPGWEYVVRFNCPEFTSNCPITGAPDFAQLLIDYIPDTLMIESKSLKLFLGSFRHIGSFHEACTMKIADRLMQAMQPKWLRISGIWFARGGISLDIFYQTGEPPKNVCIPELSYKVR